MRKSLMVLMMLVLAVGSANAFERKVLVEESWGYW